MTNVDYRKTVERSLTSAGFKKAGKSYCYAGNGVAVLLSVQNVEYENQFYVNVGFWLGDFGLSHPDRVELTHLYYRLERLFPECRETILRAGKIDDTGQLNAFVEFDELLRKKILARLVELSDGLELKRAFRAGWLEHGMIRKEARDLL